MSFVMTRSDSPTAGADEVPAPIAAQFMMQVHMLQRVSAQAVATCEVFSTIPAFSADTSATAAATEAANAIAAGSGGC